MTNEQFILFLEVCKARRLNPFTNQVYGVVRNGQLTIQTAIDGFRLNADRSGKYAGQTSPYWCGPDGVWTDIWTKPTPPFASKIGVYKVGFVEPVWGVAYWDTYNAYGPFWKKAGAHMLAKCAEALALKKAFPEELSGLYTSEEMEQADTNNTIVTTVAAPVVMEEIPQPVLVFPTKIVHSWLNDKNENTALVTDSMNREWLFVGADQLNDLEGALNNGAPLMIKFKVEMNRRVVTEIE